MSLDLIARARITGDDSQAVFDVLLRTLAEPGSIRRLPPAVISRTGAAGTGTTSSGQSSGPSAASSIPIPLWTALALATVDSMVHVEPGRWDAEGAPGRPTVDWARLVADATLASVGSVEQADLVVGLGPVSAPWLATIKIGSALVPEDGARLSLLVDDLVEVTPARTPATGSVISLSGPGVPGVRSLAVAGQPDEVLLGLGRTTAVFPAGFDTWLYTPDGRIAAVPRSTEVTGGFATDDAAASDREEN